MSTLTATAHPDIAAADIVLNINTVTDTFTRSTSNGWGNTDTGQSWTTSGGAASDYSTNGTKGIQSNNSTATFRHSTLAVGVTDMRIRATLDINTGAVASAAASGVVAARLADTSNYYLAQLSFNTDDSVTLFIGKRVAGAFTALSGSVTIVTGYTANQQITVDLEVAGTTVRAKAWATATASEPTSWLVSATDSSLTAGTSAGLLSRLETGNTNGTVLFAWDNLTVDEAGQPWHVHRVYPDGSSSELLGSPVYTSGGYVVLWDTVLPLDTAIYYTAGSDISSVVLTSNTITVTGSGDGWLKDPAQPVNDLFLGTCPRVACPLDVNNDDESVSFLRIGQAQFASASGIFPIIDAARSRQVAQTRKARESSLGILSHTLAAEARVEDILASGRNLFLQLTSRYGWAWRTWSCDYIAVADATEERPPTPNMTYPHRGWGLPFALARPPFVPTGLTAGNGIGVNGATYGDATATGRTYAQRTATGNTYLMSSRGENL